MLSKIRCISPDLEFIKLKRYQIRTDNIKSLLFFRYSVVIFLNVVLRPLFENGFHEIWFVAYNKSGFLYYSDRPTPISPKIKMMINHRRFSLHAVGNVFKVFNGSGYIAVSIFKPRHGNLNPSGGVLNGWMR